MESKPSASPGQARARTPQAGSTVGKRRGYKAPVSTRAVILRETLIQDFYGKALNF